MPELNWLGDRKARHAARHVAHRLLQPVEQVGDAASGNLLIQGDNLEALKALLPLYAGRIKCIFIDPPYNTRSAFEHYDDNLEHSQWLSMMYPRLALLRELLSEDGSLCCRPTPASAPRSTFATSRTIWGCADDCSRHSASARHSPRRRGIHGLSESVGNVHGFPPSRE